MTTQIPKKDISSILIRAANWVGDAVMSTPLVRAVRKEFPSAEITMLAKPWVAPVFEHSPDVDRIMIYEADNRHKGTKGKFTLGKDLSGKGFDMAVLIQNAFEAAFIAWLAKIPIRLGYRADGRSLLLTHGIKKTKSIRDAHQVDYYLGILQGAGFETHGRDMSVYISDEMKHIVREKTARLGIAEKDPVVGVNPGAAFGSAKRWLPQGYVELSKILIQQKKAHVLVFGSGAEAALGQRIADEIGPDAHNLAGKTTLAEAMALIDATDLFITNDSGLMHVAAALKKPLVAVFGPTDHTKTAPLSDHFRLVRTPVDCSPCMKKKCPIDHRCMRLVTVDMMAAAAMELL